MSDRADSDEDHFGIYSIRSDESENGMHPQESDGDGDD